MTMRKETPIKNLNDLRAEITRLNALAREQERYLGEQYRLFNDKIAAPMRFVRSIADWIPGAGVARGLFAGRKEGEDWVSRLLRIGLPVVLNRTFLRHSGLFKRALVTLLSSQAAGTLNKDRIAAIVSKLAAWIRPSRRKHPKDVDYGIPPDSETY